MSKKKIIAIILFLFLSLFMFTFANPGDIKPELKKPEKTKQETKKEEPKEEVKEDTKDETSYNTRVVANTNNNSNNQENKKHLAAPVIKVPKDKIVILLGEKYDVMTGVEVVSEENLTVTADITDTSKLPEGTHTITYTVTDSEGNTATATVEIVIVDPNKDNDGDGASNGNEIIEGTDPLDEESFPTELIVNPKTVKIIRGRKYNVMTGVTVKGDKNNQGLEATPSLTNTAVLSLGSHTVTYTVKDNYNKTLTGERIIIVASDINHNNIPDDEETYTLTINYVFENGEEAANTYTRDILQGRRYTVTSPTIKGYIVDKFIVTGTMPKHDKDVTVTYTLDANGDLIPDKYQGKLTVTYVMDDGSEAPKAFERYYLKGSMYIVPSPRVSGYIVDRRIVTGFINQDTKEEIVTYYADKNGDGIPDKDQRRLIVTYVMDDGTEAPDSDEIYYLIGADYSFDVPQIEGYMSYDKNFSGTMGEEDVEKTVTYYKDVNGDNIPDKFQGVLTINYVMEDGSEAPESYVEYYIRGQYYYVSIPKIEGYVASKSSVSGWMIRSSQTETITYYIDSNNDGVADRNQGKLTINYVMEDGSEAPAPYTNYYSMNRTYRVESPKIEGYVASKSSVSGRMTRKAITETVTYYIDSNNDGVADRNQGKLTINYVMEDGSEAPAPYTNYYSIWSTYSVEIPEIDGYVADKTTVSGRMTRKAITETVTYYVDADGNGEADKTQDFTVTFYDETGENILGTSTVKYGETAVAPTVTKEADKQYTYEFDNWYKQKDSNEIDDLTNVVLNRSVYARFTSELRKYTVTWADDDDTELYVDENVEYGTVPSYEGETPTKVSDARCTYTFAGWSPAIDSIEGNVKYNATYDCTVKTYSITWLDGDENTLKTETLEYGAVPSYEGEAPTKASDGTYEYTFNGEWSPSISSVVGNEVYRAQFDSYELNSAPTFKKNHNITYIFKKEHTSEGIMFTLTFNVADIANGADRYSVNLKIAGLGFDQTKEIDSSNGGSVTFKYLQPFTYSYFENLLLKTHYSVEELIVNVNAINNQGSTTQTAKLWSGVGVNGGALTSVGIAEQDPTNHLFDIGDVLDAITGTWQNYTYTITNWH